MPEEQPDGIAYLSDAKFRSGFAADTNEADAAFLRDSQVPIAMAELKAKVTVAALTGINVAGVGGVYWRRGGQERAPHERA